VSAAVSRATTTTSVTSSLATSVYGQAVSATARRPSAPARWTPRAGPPSPPRRCRWAATASRRPTARTATSPAARRRRSPRPSARPGPPPPSRSPPGRRPPWVSR
jgi:hypothetical protein